MANKNDSFVTRHEFEEFKGRFRKMSGFNMKIISYERKTEELKTEIKILENHIKSMIQILYKIRESTIHSKVRYIISEDFEELSTSILGKKVFTDNMQKIKKGR